MFPKAASFHMNEYLKATGKYVIKIRAITNSMERLEMVPFVSSGF